MWRYRLPIKAIKTGVAPMTVFKLTAAAALAIVGYAAFATSANASVSSELNKCRYNTKSKVINCCERVLRDEQRPLWMIESGDNCRTAAVCFPSRRGVIKASFGGAPNCFIRFRVRDGGSRPNVTPKYPDIPVRDIPQRPTRDVPTRGD
jgi:hypothetical protein